jgi:hypothetical protein
MKKHLLLWFKNLGGAYVAADLASRQGARILELFPFGTKSHLLLEVDSQFNSKKLLASLKNKPQKKIELTLPETVMQAYLSLINPPLDEELLIVESQFLGDIFSACQKADGAGLAILDLRFTRDSSGYSYSMLTGKSADCKGFSKKPPRGCKVSRISNPSAGLAEFFPRAT